MARLKDLESGPVAERRYVAKRFVYLESEEDVQILGERWFIDRAEKVEFLPAGDGSGGGCTRVVGRVREDREALIDAWGIVDRDALTQQGRWTEFFETDDGVFATIEPLHPHVKVLRCWEIENYLLHPEIIEEFLVDEHGRSRRPLNQVLEGVFDIVCRLIPIVAANLILNRDGRTKLPDGFGLGQLFEDIYQGVRSRIECDLSPEAADELDNFVEKIVAFSGSVSHRSLDHWLRQIRIVDGKRLIRWLRHEHNLGDRDVRWHLARLTRDRRRIADELEQMIVDLVA